MKHLCRCFLVTVNFNDYSTADKVPDSADKMPDTMKTMPNKEVINRYCKKVGLTISGKMVYNRWQKKKILRGGV